MKKTLPALLAVLTAVVTAASARAAFADVPADAWYAEGVAQAAEAGWMSGYADGSFRPDNPVTRAQFVTMLYRMDGASADSPAAPFADTDPDAWYAPAVNWAAQNGIADTSGGLFHPGGTVSRLDAAVFLWRYAVSDGADTSAGTFVPLSDYPDASSLTGDTERAMQWAVGTGILRGAGNRLLPDSGLTRAEAAVLLTRYGRAVHMTEAVYLGVQNYGTVSADEKDRFRYRFFADGAEHVYPAGSAGQGPEYALQNRLKEGALYLIAVENGVLADAVELRTAAGTVTQYGDGSVKVGGVTLELTGNTRAWRIDTRPGGAAVTEAHIRAGDAVRMTADGGAAKSVYLTQVSAPYTPPIQAQPGLHTLRNFLASALTPVGTTLYVYGGGWNWQDTPGSSVPATTIGIPQDWPDFFRAQTADYTYKNPNAARSYYPFGKWNEYWYAGLDCSGFLGWTIYNTLHTESGGEGYVFPAVTAARRMSERGWGTWNPDAAPLNEDPMKPGDVMSISGHVWISLGTCQDGSVVIVHSTPSPSRTGQPGGGVQLSAVGNAESCEAYRLADQYMRTYYPAWYERYPVRLLSPASYFRLPGGDAGRFRWNAFLSDPDGFQAMSAADVLASLFG